MPFGALLPQPAPGDPWWMMLPEMLRPKPGMLQYMAGQPQTPMPDESRVGFGIRSGIFNALSGLDRGVASLNADVAQGLNYALGPAAAASAPAPAAAQAFAGGRENSNVTRRNQSTTPAGDIFAFTRVPGDTITSQYRDPSKNRQVGGVANSFHTRRDSAGNPMAVDLVPPKGVSMSQYHAMLRERNPTLDVLNEGDHVHMEPRTGPGSTMRTAMQVAGFQPPPAPNYGGLQRADQLYQEIGNLQMQPFSASYTPQDLPDLPTPELQQGVDWSAGDTAFEQARPVNPFGGTEEERKEAMAKMSRAGLFQGLARAMTSFNGSEGLGATLARIGGGMLAGRLKGNEDVQERMDQFDEAMRRYNAALANREDGKAQNAANVANHNITTMNQFARDKWAQEVREVEKYQPRMEGGVLITKDRNPQTGEVTETHTPLDPSRRAASLYGRANVAQAAGNLANDFEQMNYRFNQSVASAILPSVMAEMGGAGDYNGRNNVLGVGLYEASDALVEMGQWENLLTRLPNGAAIVEQLKSEGYRAAGVPVNEEGRVQTGTTLNEAQLKAYNNYLTSAIVPELVNQGKMHWLVGGTVQDVDPRTGKPVPGTRRTNPQQETVSAVEAFRAKDRTISRTTNAKGQITTRESYDGR